MRWRIAAALGLIILSTGCTQSAASPAPVARAATRPPSDILSAEEYRRFIGTVSTELRSRDLTATLGPDWVQVRGGWVKPTTFGLRNLMQTCRGLPQEQWGSAISEHFDNLLETMRQQAGVAQRLSDFEQARAHLVVRLYSADAVPADARRHIVSRVDLPGTLTVLMLDLPKAVQSVSPDMAQSWKRSRPELFTIALENVRHKATPDQQQIEMSGGSKLLILEGTELITSSHVLLLRDHPQALGRFGAIVAVPTRNRVMCLPVNDTSIARAAAEMAPMVQQARQAGPGATSDKLYWYHDGRFSEVPMRLENGTLIVRIPDELTQAMGSHPIRTASGSEPGDR